MNLAKKIKRDFTIDVVFTAEDWGLYTATQNCDATATRLNETLANSVNSGFKRPEVRRRVELVMNACAADGAADSEPRQVLESALKFIYA